MPFTAFMRIITGVWGITRKYRNLKKGFAQNPDKRDFMRALAAGYREAGDTKSMKLTISEWLKKHPGDNEMKAFLEETQK
jgi:hypothetical protein